MPRAAFTTLCRVPYYAALPLAVLVFVGGGLVFVFGAIGIIRDSL